VTPTESALLNKLRDHTDFTGTCWVWQGAGNGRGYGLVRVADKLKYVHRVSFELMMGAIPSGLEIDHLCRNRACWRPDHLEPVTHQENMRRSRAALVG